MHKFCIKTLWTTVAGVLLLATTTLAQPGYQWFNAVPGLNDVYFCEDGTFIGDLFGFDEPTDFNQANGFFCCGAAVEHTLVASLSQDCSSPIAEASFTPAADKFYYLTLAGDNAAGKLDDAAAIEFIITETDGLHAAFPAGTEGTVYVTLAHLSPDAPEVTGIVRETGTVLHVGTFGTVTPLDVPFPSVLGAVTIDVYPEAQLAAGDTSNPIMTVPVDLGALDARGAMAAVTGYAGGGPPLSTVGILDDGTVITLAGGAGEGRMVSLWLNTATLPDTIDASNLIEVRGCLAGCEDNISELPDGNSIAWDNRTTVEPMNMGGDYWHTSFMIPEEIELQFKFYSEHSESVAEIGGWEDGDNHVIPAGSGDVDMGLHFFNKSGGNLDYDWRPYEEKEDTVAILFRTYANTEDAFTQGYDRDTSMVGVRGDSAASGGALSWDVTQVLLEPESDTENRPGEHLWSGVAYYPASTAGNVQPFKFVLVPPGWESSPDRMFTVPDRDTTLHWTYFSDSPPLSGVELATAFTIFSVDLTPLETIGIFDLARGDTLEIRGEFNGWDCAGEGSPDDCLLDRVPGEPIFEGPVSPITAFPETSMRYKFFLNLNNETFMEEFGEAPPSGWEEPISTTGADRSFVFEGDPDNDQFLGPFFFNDVFPENILPGDGAAGSKTAATVDVTFTVDMSAAIDDPASPFNPATDTVTAEFGDPIWAFTQDVPGTLDAGNYVPSIDAGFFSLDPAPDLGENVYQGTLTVVGPTYAAIQYKYAYAQPGGTSTVEMGGTTAGLGRRRTRFVPQNADGSFPASWDFPMETYQPTGNLPFEENPAAPTAIEPVGSELPGAISLGDNYPNPFNPSTTFEYSVTNTEHVTVAVYDLTGRLVTTLVDGVQPAQTYRVTFEARDMASGVYIYQLKTADRTISKKMLLLK